MRFRRFVLLPVLLAAVPGLTASSALAADEGHYHGTVQNAPEQLQSVKFAISDDAVEHFTLGHTVVFDRAPIHRLGNGPWFFFREGSVSALWFGHVVTGQAHVRGHTYHWRASKE